MLLTQTPGTGLLLDLNDILLAPLIRAEDADEAERMIGELVAQVAIPLATRIIRGYSHSQTLLCADDVEDLVALVAMRLMLKLRATRNAEEHAVRSVERYVTRLTYNAIHDHFRERFPERARLKNRLRYLLAHTRELALWTTSDGLLACGLARWKGEGVCANTIDPLAFDVGSDRDPIGTLLRVFRRLGHPVELDVLVALMARVSNLEERSLESVNADTTAAPRTNIADHLEQRELLARLWREILELRPLQRKALLLNLRDPETTHALTLLIASEMASFEELAAALELSSSELNAIWSDLPLDDQRIAALLGVTRQQVINLRQAARTRLGRRLSR